jgi:hypothetical protein
MKPRSLVPRLFPWRDAWRIPGALLSFGFYAGSRWLVRILADRHVRKNGHLARHWQVLSRAFVNRPGAIAYLLTSAPRWNPHAVIATAGPLMVREACEIEVGRARESAAAWFFVFYGNPERRTTGSISSLGQSNGAAMRFFVPRAGSYNVVARYYQPRLPAFFPVIRVDGREAIPEQQVPPDANDFYRELPSRAGPFSGWLAWHVYPLLRFRHWLPSRWVERIYLPVGNPETRFQYGTIEPGERLYCRMPREKVADYLLYVTIYSLRSIPILWYHVDGPENLGPPCPGRGFYLVRLQPTTAGATPLSPREWDGLVRLYHDEAGCEQEPATGTGGCLPDARADKTEDCAQNPASLTCE